MTVKITPHDLLVELSALYRVQPATALWRAVEIAEILDEGLPSGLGLDLGCGDGALTGLILRHLGTKTKLIGLDYDPGEIAVAKQRGVYDSTVCCGGEDMDLADNSVDFVFSNSVLEHLTALDETIGECARVLSPGGQLIATVPQPDFQDLLRGPWLPWRKRSDYVAKINARLAHHNYLNADQWASLLAKHGLQLQSHRAYLNRSQVRRWQFFSSMTAGVLQAFGASNAMLYRLQRFTRADNPNASGLLSEHRPGALQHLWAWLVAGRALRATPTNEPRMGCLLIRAAKPK